MEAATKPQCNDESLLEIVYSTFGNFGLLTAHKMRLFTIIGAEGLTGPEVANALGISERPAEILLTILTTQGLLLLDAGRYFLQP